MYCGRESIGIPLGIPLVRNARHPALAYVSGVQKAEQTEHHVDPFAGLHKGMVFPVSNPDGAAIRSV